MIWEVAIVAVVGFAFGLWAGICYADWTHRP